MSYADRDEDVVVDLWIACEIRMPWVKRERESPLHASPLSTGLCSKKRSTERCASMG